MTGRFPHPLALLTAGIVLAAAVTYVLPAGEFARQLDPVTNRRVVVAGTYHPVPPSPASLMGVLLAVPKGIADAVDVIAAVFLVGAAFVVVDRTGALRASLGALVAMLGARATLAIPICCVAFALAGALQNMQEEIIALIPVLAMLSLRLGADGVTTVAMSLGAAAVGAAFSPINPFQVGIAQQVSEVPLFSGAGFRSVTLAAALALWIWRVQVHARRVRAMRVAAVPTVGTIALGGTRVTLIMLLVGLAFAVFIVGLVRAGWGFNELSAVFFAMGVLAGLAGGLGANGTASAFVDGFRDMAFAAILIGCARGIFVVLNDAHVIDTIVNNLFAPLVGLPSAVAALGMVAVHTVVHVPVPSVSGQAVLTMPILAPLSDLLHISRQVTILAYQVGAGLCELITPTNGALMAVLAAAQVRYDEWIRFAGPAWALMVACGVGAILIGLLGVGL